MTSVWVSIVNPDVQPFRPRCVTQDVEPRRRDVRFADQDGPKTRLGQRAHPRQQIAPMAIVSGRNGKERRGVAQVPNRPSRGELAVA